MWKHRKFKQQEFVPLIKFLIEMYSPRNYVEIGVQNAWTFNQISPLVPSAIAVDINAMPKVDMHPHVQVLQQSSQDFAMYWQARAQTEIDLLLIDGDHRSPQVSRDFNRMKDYITVGTGIVLMHDTYPSAPYLLSDGYCSDAWRSARRIHTGRNYKDWEIFTFPGPYAGMSILRHSPGHHLHWQRKEPNVKPNSPKRMGDSTEMGSATSAHKS